MCISPIISFSANLIIYATFDEDLGFIRTFSCLMSSIFIITLIMCIIKTTCFNNTILIAELEGKLP